MTTTTTLLFLMAGVQAGPDRIDLEPGQMTLDAGETVTVAATVRAADGTVLQDAPVRWIAMDPEVAAVDRSGRVTAVSPGEARIAARSGNVMSFAAVVVARASRCPPGGDVAAGHAPGRDKCAAKGDGNRAGR